MSGAEGQTGVGGGGAVPKLTSASDRIHHILRFQRNSEVIPYILEATLQFSLFRIALSIFYYVLSKYSHYQYHSLIIS